MTTTDWRSNGARIPIPDTPAYDPRLVVVPPTSQDLLNPPTDPALLLPRVTHYDLLGPAPLTRLTVIKPQGTPIPYVWKATDASGRFLQIDGGETFMCGVMEGGN